MRRLYLITLLIGFNWGYTQETPSYAEQLAELEASMDSASIFYLIDSLLYLEQTSPSELHIRMGYSTNVTSAGRDFGINQTAISPGISYYHSSGFYADLAGFWNSETDPAYNPTILSIGYLGFFKNNKWNYTLDAERWFYNPADSSENPLSYSLGASLSYDFTVGYASVDYSYLFGKETAHRLITNITFKVDLGAFWIFKDVGFYPSANLMIGNSEITLLRVSNQQISGQTAQRISRLTSFSNLTENQQKFLSAWIRRLYRDQKIDQQTRNELLFDLRTSQNFSSEDQALLNNLLEEGFDVNEYVDANAFGILNYSFSLPLSLNTNRFNFLLSYTYSVPVQLPGEFITAEPVGYFSSSISYRIPLK